MGMSMYVGSRNVNNIAFGRERDEERFVCILTAGAIRRNAEHRGATSNVFRGSGPKGGAYLSMPMISILNHCKVGSKAKIMGRNASARAEGELKQSARLQI